MKRSPLKKITLLLFVIIFVVACSANNSTNTKEDTTVKTNASAEKAVDIKEPINFPTKNITFIIPYNPGGGFDTTARLLGIQWQKHLNTNFIMENKSGAQGNIGLGELTRANPDGYTVGLINIPGHVPHQIVGDAQYDLNEFEYIGVASSEKYMFAASKKSGIKNVEDLKNAERILSGASVNATSGLVERITMDAIGKQYDIATIGEGSSELVLSNVRGEIDIVASPYDNLIGYAQNDDITPLWVYSDERYPDLPDTPTISEIGFPELTNTGTIARIIVAPPGTPEEILTILREAFDKAIAEPDVKGTLPMSGDYRLAEDLVKAAFVQVEPLKEDLINNR